MRFSEFSEIALPSIEKKMRETLDLARINQNFSLSEMLSFHLGWSGEMTNQKTQGKRIRPLVLLLTNETSGGNWKDAVPAAAAIELLHNFSLIHDDIEDISTHRRGRLTLWKLYGVPLALNAGDALFSLSYLCLSTLENLVSDQIFCQTFQIFSQACLSLTKGQHLDISFEQSHQISVEEYLEMIGGKTASLLATSAQLGSLLAGSDSITQRHYFEFGKNMGLAFQIFDDILGIWGDPIEMGKSIASDLKTRKKTLPILFGLAQNGRFKNMWLEQTPESKIQEMAAELKNEGAFDFAVQTAEDFTSKALDSLSFAAPSGSAEETLTELSEILTKRKF